MNACKDCRHEDIDGHSFTVCPDERTLNECWKQRDFFDGLTSAQSIQRDKETQAESDCVPTWQDWAKIGGVLILVIVIVAIIDWRKSK